MDILHDNSYRTLYRIVEDHPSLVPSYVTESGIDKEAAAEYPDRQFADDVNRTFPLDTKAATWLSAAYFAKTAESAYRNKDMGRYVEDRILKAADAFGIAKDVETITAAIKAGRIIKAASPVDADYGYVERDSRGTVIARQYPMFDERGVKLAAEHFMENRSKYPLEMRREIAGVIMKKAEQYEITGLNSSIRKEAGLGIPRRDFLMVELLKRAEMVKDAELAVALANINNLVNSSTLEELEPNLHKIAEIVELIDKTSGLHKEYGRKVLAPAEFLYDIDIKEAAAMAEDTVELSKYLFSLKKLASLEPSVYSDCLGEDFSERIVTAGKIDSEKLANELGSLPLPDRRALEQHLEQAFTR